ncbi:MAG: ABC transporter permease, partial [Acidobacteria bacterium]|nr:ABC transporter permease [Acidobacteriota bacterium]
PGFAAVAILTLALGIGINTAVFSVVNGVLLKPLPYPHPEQLVALAESKPNFDFGSISFPNFRDWRKDNHTFSAMALTRSQGFLLIGHGDSELISGDLVSSDFFSMLNIKPLLGRTFLPGEDEVGAPPIALISETLWKEKFGGDPNILGKAINLGGDIYSIVGVVPKTFDLLIPSFRTGLVYLPIGQWTNNLLLKRGAGLGFHGIGRLKDGVSIEQARADMETVSRNLTAAYPDTDTGIGANLTPIKQAMTGESRSILWVLQAAVGFVLLIACVNVANLLLARSTSRQREFAVRVALGARPGRVIRQLLTESVLLAFAGGMLGLALAKWGTKAALTALPRALSRAGEVGIDGRVLAFTAMVCVVVGIAFGMAPALKMSSTNLLESLKNAGRAFSGVRMSVQRVFVVIEIATALVLLMGAGLMLRSMVGLWKVNPGFDPHRVLTFNVSLPPSMNNADPDAIRSALRDVQQNISSIPGIEASSLTWGAFPLAYDDEELFWIEGHPKPASSNDMSWALKYVVSPDYLKAMGIPLLRGRFLTQQDSSHSLRAAVVDEEFARKFFPNEDPLGKRLRFSDTEFAEIVGVVGHVKQWGLDSDATQALRAEMYLSLMQLPDGTMGQIASGVGMLVRSETNSPSLFADIRAAFNRANSDVALYAPQTVDQIVSSTLAERRFAMILLGAFAGLALLLASIGIYGVLAYLVGQRTQEIGIRMALGARRLDVLRLILADGTTFILLGIAAGMAASFGLTRLMRSMLYGVKPTDPITFAAVAVALGAVALFACYLPAYRAMKVNPIVALRYE